MASFILKSLTFGLLLFVIVAENVGCRRATSQTAASRDEDLTGLTADMGRATNLLAVGEWSKPVRDGAGYVLRGRLLLFDAPQFVDSQTYWGNAPVYLELENLSPNMKETLAVYFALQDGLECEVRDGRNRPVLPTPLGFIFGSSMPYTRQFWVTVPFGGSVRLRGDPPLGGHSPSQNGRIIQFGYDRRWLIPDVRTNRYFLAGTFSPPTSHPSPPGAHVWQGTLVLPAVEIPMPKE
jgi:hypothetical protein